MQHPPSQPSTGIGTLPDYRLRLYGTREYLDQHPPVTDIASLSYHTFNSYIDDLAFSLELLYLDHTIPNASSRFRSTSVIAQYFAALQGHSLAILPCFMAAQQPRLISVLQDDIAITRCFWLCCREDLRKLRRITSVWDYLRAVADCNRSFLMGESFDMARIS
jgi:DNA-binding transcriptional LysR family regulator